MEAGNLQVSQQVGWLPRNNHKIPLLLPTRGYQPRSFGLMITSFPGRHNRTKSVLSMSSFKVRTLPSANVATTTPGCPDDGRAVRYGYVILAPEFALPSLMNSGDIRLSVPDRRGSYVEISPVAMLDKRWFPFPSYPGKLKPINATITPSTRRGTLCTFKRISLCCTREPSANTHDNEKDAPLHRNSASSLHNAPLRDARFQ